MPLHCPKITARDMVALRFQLNEALGDVFAYIEELKGVDAKNPTIHNFVVMTQNKITDMADGSESDDAATVGQVESQWWKHFVFAGA